MSNSSEFARNGQNNEGLLYLVPSDIRTSVVLIVSVLIICSNILNLCVLRVTHQIPTISRLCLLNLSCADLLVGVVACAPSVYPAVTGRWPYGILCCQIAGIAHGMSVTVSIWSLAMVSVDRYVAIIHPLKYPTLLTPLRCKVTLGLMWVLAFCTFFAPLPTKPNFVYYKFNPAESMCGLHWEYPWFCVITAVYIPVFSGLVLLFSTIRVSKKIVVMKKRRDQMIYQPKSTSHTSVPMCLCSQNSKPGSPYLNTPLKREHSESANSAYMSCPLNEHYHDSRDTSSALRTTPPPPPPPPHQRFKLSKASTNLRDLKVVKVLSVTSLVYFSAWGPYVVQVILYSFMPYLPPRPTLMFAFLWLANSNSFMNVIIYSVMYASFRRTIIRTVTKCFS